MLTLVLDNVKFEEGVEWKYTNWEVATKENFERSSIVAMSYKDTENKQLKRFNIQCDPNTKYYGRAQIVSTMGAHAWSNLDVFKGKALEDNPNKYVLPAPITIPDIKTDSDINNHIPVGFNIMTGKYSTYGNAKHVATTYWIEDLNGNIVWLDKFDKLNKTSKLVNDIILTKDNIYRIKAMFHSEANITSTISTTTIYVGGNNTDSNISKLALAIKDYDTTSNIDITITPNNKKDAKEFTFSILEYGDVVDTIYEAKVKLSSYSYNIPRNIIKPNTIYVILLKYDNEKCNIHTITETFS